VKVLLPRSRKPLEFDAKTGYDKNQWAAVAKESGPAARTGDQVQITRIDLEDDKIVLQINGGFKAAASGMRTCRSAWAAPRPPSRATGRTRPPARRLRSCFTSLSNRLRRRPSRRCWRR